MGEAKAWADGAQKQDYTVKKAPSAATVVVALPDQIPNAEKGFVGFVEKVYDSGAVLVSEYGQVKKGRLSYRVIDANQAQTLSYIHPKTSISKDELTTITKR